jgi:radical SAM protein with 4Fe4S-binding SPASM domain
MPLDPEVKPLLEFFESLGFPDPEAVTPAELRESMTLPPAERATPVGAVLNRSVPGPAGDIPLRIYQPDEDGEHPLLMFFHGGGWVVGDLETGLDPDRLERLREPLCRPAADCLGCTLRPLCTSSCPCTNLSRTGTVNEPDGLVCFLEDLSVRVAEAVLETAHPTLATMTTGGEP